MENLVKKFDEFINERLFGFEHVLVDTSDIKKYAEKTNNKLYIDMAKEHEKIERTMHELYVKMTKIEKEKRKEFENDIEWNKLYVEYRTHSININSIKHKYLTNRHEKDKTYIKYINLYYEDLKSTDDKEIKKSLKILKNIK